MITVAITGRSGSGKSTVTKQFSNAGIPVVDADKIAREVLAPGSVCLYKLKIAFGEDICNEGVLNRRLLADRAFATAAGTKTLTDITHPEILRRICFAKETAKQNGAAIFAIDGAVILDTPCADECDVVVVVTASQATSIARIVARDKITPEMAHRRLQAQMSTVEMCSYANYIIQNDGDLPALLQQIDDTITHLRRDADATKAPNEL